MQIQGYQFSVMIALHQEVLAHYNPDKKGTQTKVSSQIVFFRANPLKKEESVDNCASLQVLGAPACAALGRSQHSVQTLSVAGITLFWSFELLGIFLQENTSIHHFCCQTEKILAGELPAFLDKGKDTGSIIAGKNVSYLQTPVTGCC